MMKRLIPKIAIAVCWLMVSVGFLVLVAVWWVGLLLIVVGTLGLWAVLGGVKGLIFLGVTMFFLAMVIAGAILSSMSRGGDILALIGVCGVLGGWGWCAKDDSTRPDGSERLELGPGSPPDLWQ